MREYTTSSLSHSLDYCGRKSFSLFLYIQFWGIPNILHLSLDETGLKFLPASIGRLRELKALSLKNNCLSSLPHTLSFCSKLEELHLEDNLFTVLPGVIVYLESLHTLTRHGNPLLPTSADLASRARRSNYIQTVQEKQPPDRSDQFGVVLPLKLLAVQQVLTNRTNYWEMGRVAPAICKMIDLVQSKYRICDSCHAVKLREERGA